MRVLIAHNLYRSATPSGENQLVRAEIGLLREHGVDVVEMLADSDDIAGGVRGVLQAAPGPVYARAGVRRFTGLLDETRPDVVHVHNVFPLISPWIVRVAHGRGVPVVQTVHNYRHGCINGLHLRDGHVCTDCVGTRLGLPGVQHGCYRGSRLQSAPMALGQLVHRGTWHDDVARFLALTPFMRDRLVDYGLPLAKIAVRPTWVPDPGAAGTPGQDVLFVGRLDVAKGVDLLLEAWSDVGRSSGRRLLVAGDGPLRDAVRAAARHDPTLEWLGFLDGAGVGAALARAAYVVVPSRFFEGYPLVVAEAFGRGRAVLTVTGGSVGSVVDDEVGWVVPCTRSALAAALSAVTPAQAEARGRAARARYEAENSPASAFASLSEVYRSVTEAYGVAQA